VPLSHITPQPYVAAETKTAKVKSIGGSLRRGVAVVVLGDGTAIRMHGPDAFHVFAIGGTVAYDVDAYGNRFNPRQVEP
jgi:hypothetical protein